MKTRDVKNATDARNLVEERRLDHVKIGIFDIDGVMRGKYVSREKFFSALDKGFGWCDVVLAWDSNDQLYDNVTFSGWHTGYPDTPVRILPDTCRDLPFEGDMVLFLCEFAEPGEALCPRGILRRVLNRADAMGFDVAAALEYEFFLFEETPHSVREKNYRNLTNITPGFFGYSTLRSSVLAEFYHEIMTNCAAMEIDIESLHTETGPGVLEAALTVDDGLAAGDKAALFKTFTKVIAQRRGWMATFMAKWSPDYPGQSGHIHVSLKDKRGRAAFYDPDTEHNISTTMRHFIGGQQALMPETLSMVASTVNSYTRLIPGFWAPTDANWGIENRTCALRAIHGSENAQRVEYRIAAADANPYLALAAAIGTGLWGIEHKIEPDAPVAGNAYDKKSPAKRAVPRTLMEAAERLRKSKAARELFGDGFVEHFAASRDWEEREFRKAITDWELQRYFEII